METYPRAEGSSPTPARNAASQAVLETEAETSATARHRERHSEITIGAGVKRPQGRALPVTPWSAQAFADNLGKLTGVESWWSPHLFTGDYRIESKWQAAVALALDLDFHNGDGEHAAMPDDARARLKRADLPGNVFHFTPRGARLVAILAQPVTDADTYAQAIEGFAAQTRAALQAAGCDGLDVDAVCHDRARLLFTPRATVSGHARAASVVVLREELHAPSDFPPVADPAPVDASPTTAPNLPPVPWDSLPGSLGDYGRAVALNMEAPEPLVFGAMLAAMSAAVPATARIEGRAGHFEIAPVWIAPVAQPGSKKTPVLNRLLAPLESHDAKLQAAFAQAQESHRAECAAMAKANKGKQSKAEQPPEPERAHLVCDDFTLESLAELLATNHRHGLGVIVAPDELLALFGNLNAYKRNGNDRQRLLKLWSGQAIRVNRQKRFVYAPTPRAALIGGIQPAVAVSLQALDESDGLLERLHWIDAREERAPVFDVPSVPPALEAEYRARLSALLPDLSPADLRPDPQAVDGEADAVTYTLSADAREAFRDFYLTCDRRGLRGWEAGYMGKIAGQCLRVALTLHHVEHGRDVFKRAEVDGDTMRAAVTVTQWLAAHTARVRSELSATPRHAPQVEAGLRWLRKHGGRAFLRDVQRANVAGVKSAEEAEALGAALVAAGVAVWGTTDTTAGASRREIILTEGGK